MDTELAADLIERFLNSRIRATTGPSGIIS